MVKLFGKKFGKSNDFLEADKAFGGLGAPGPASDTFANPKANDTGFPQLNTSLPAPATQPMGDEKLGRIINSVELLSSKLDNLKSSIDMLNQRIASLENDIKQIRSPQPTPQQTQQQQYNPQPSYPAFGQQQQAQQQPTQQDDQGWHY